MRFPKNRANLYLVERLDRRSMQSTICGGFSEPEDADAFRDACEQEWKDKHIEDGGTVMFGVVMTTFYG